LDHRVEGGAQKVLPSTPVTAPAQQEQIGCIFASRRQDLRAWILPRADREIHGDTGAGSTLSYLIRLG
jgi:hypothetical protein